MDFAAVRALNTPLTLGAPSGSSQAPAGSVAVSPVKTALLEMQTPIGESIFKLEQALARMKAAGTGAKNETNLRWLADFDFAHARLETELIFLFEYNYALGQIRAGRLPDLGKEHDGWKIAALPKITIPEMKAKQLAKDRLKVLAKIQNDYPDTPWAYFAERESRRELGIQWAPKTK